MFENILKFKRIRRIFEKVSLTIFRTKCKHDVACTRCHNISLKLPMFQLSQQSYAIFLFFHKFLPLFAPVFESQFSNFRAKIVAKTWKSFTPNSCPRQHITLQFSERKSENQLISLVTFTRSHTAATETSILNCNHIAQFNTIII